VGEWEGAVGGVAQVKACDVIIIGGGAVGCAIAYTLSRYHINVALLERCGDVAMGASGKNSAVVHAGFNNKPGSLMARLCVEGNKRFEEFCKTLDVPYRRDGKLVVALNEDDLAIIDSILAAGVENGCAGLEKIGPQRLREMEPGITGIGALYSANTAVFDPFLYTIHLCEAAIQNGVSFYMNNEVREIRKENNRFVVTTHHDEYACDFLINAAGLYADKVAALAGDDAYKIYPCRGEYLILDDCASTLISRPVYPVPRQGVGGLGVHLTTTVDGGVLIGPGAEYVDGPEEYETTASAQEALFAEAQVLLPALRRDMVIGSYTGIRAKLVPKGEANYGDFIIRESNAVENLFILMGIESPGLTASIPIAEMVTAMVLAKKNFSLNTAFRTPCRGRPVFANCTAEAQDALIQQEAGYGEVVCRCKTVTRAEVAASLRNPLGVRTVTALRNRVHVTRGRCQGGYCFTRIARILQDEFGLAPEEIAYRYEGDRPFAGAVK